MPYVLQIQNTTPPIYIGISNGFIDKVETENQALQFNRNSDANAFSTILVDAVTAVSLP